MSLRLIIRYLSLILKEYGLNKDIEVDGYILHFNKYFRTDTLFNTEVDEFENISYLYKCLHIGECVTGNHFSFEIGITKQGNIQYIGREDFTEETFTETFNYLTKKDFFNKIEYLYNKIKLRDNLMNNLKTMEKIEKKCKI